MCNTYWVDVLATSTQQQWIAMYSVPRRRPICVLTCSLPCLPLVPLWCMMQLPVHRLAVLRASERATCPCS